MRTFLLLAAAGVIASGPAFAEQFKGVVAEIDAAAHTVVMKNGTALVITDSVDASDIEVGETVTVTTNDDTGKVTDIYPVE